MGRESIKDSIVASEAQGGYACVGEGGLLGVNKNAVTAKPVRIAKESSDSSNEPRSSSDSEGGEVCESDSDYDEDNSDLENDDDHIKRMTSVERIIYGVEPSPYTIKKQLSRTDIRDSREAEEEEKEEILGSDDEEQEDPFDYCKGGYHPV